MAFQFRREELEKHKEEERERRQPLQEEAERPRPLTKERLESLFQDLESDDLSARRRAVQILAASKDIRALEPLCLVVIGDKSGFVRQLAAETLGELGDDRAVEVLLQAQADENQFVRDQADKALVKITGHTAVELCIYGASSKDWRVRMKAAQNLGRLRDETAIDTLLTLLFDEAMEVRRNAIVALGKLKSIKAVVPLMKAVATDKESSVRWVAAVALGDIGDPRALETLAAATKDRDAKVRGAAETALTRFS